MIAMLPLRRLTSWTVIFISCCKVHVSSRHYQITVESSLVNLKATPLVNILRARRECPRVTPSSDLRNIVLDLRGGSSYENSGNGGDNYHDRYGNYRDDRDNEGGYNNDGGQNKHAYDHDENGQDGYYGDDYGYDRRKDDYGYYDDEGRYRSDYEDQGRQVSSHRKSRTAAAAGAAFPSSPKLPTGLTASNSKLGTILLSVGAAFTALGITLFFNKTLMRLGNLLFVAGVPLTIGPSRTARYFLQPKKARATGCLGCGLFLVLIGHPLLGILLEVFGLLNLFGNMFPLVMMMVKNLPIVGKLFGSNNGGNRGEKRKESRYNEDKYYEEEYNRWDEQNDRY